MSERETIRRVYAERARPLFAERIERGLTPGSVVAVFDSRGLAFGNGMGRCDERGRRPTLDTAFRIASCTKSFTAVAVLQARDAGLLHLDDPIDEYLEVGPLLLHGRAQPAPSIRMLLSMSGGLPTDDPWADRLESQPTAEFDRMTALGYHLISIPGTAYEYSNLGFALLGRIIERVRARSFRDVVTRDILRPLGLTVVGFDERVAAPDGVATGYVRRDDEWLAMPVSGPGAFSPIGGVFATARGLSAWAAWLASAFSDEPRGTDNATVWATGTSADAVLDRVSRRELQQAARPMPMRHGDAMRSIGYGYGLVRETDARGREIVSHSGGYPGFSAHMRWNPQTRIGVVGFENARYSGVSAPVTEALGIILDALDGERAQRSLDLWPETLAARDAVEHLARGWDSVVADALFAPNVELDEPIERRRVQLAHLMAASELSPRSAPLGDCDPWSTSPAHLAWTMRGERGDVRAEVRLTPDASPRVQTLRLSALDPETSPQSEE